MGVKRFVVLGGTGEMGRYVVKDLFETCKDSTIIVAARDPAEVRRFAAQFRSTRVKGVVVDVTDVRKTAALLRDADVCVNSVNYYFNLDVMKACLLAGCHYVDLGGLYHTTRKQLRLSNQFRKKRLLAVLGCGSTPGITNVMIAYAAQSFDMLHAVDIRFGGHDWSNYQQHFVLPYTAYTLFDEFTRDPIVYDHGKAKKARPMTGKDTYTFPKPVGKKICFYTLHSELATIPENYKKKGLKRCSFRVCFPEDFVHDVSLLIELGLASRKPVLVKGKKVVPVDVTAKELSRTAMPKHVKVNDMEFIWVDIAGTRKGKAKNLSIYCESHSNPRWNASAGAVDTAVPPSIIAQMIAGGKIAEKGVLPPERCIDPILFFRELKKRKLIVKVGGKRVV